MSGWFSDGNSKKARGTGGLQSPPQNDLPPPATVAGIGEKSKETSDVAKPVTGWHDPNLAD